MLRFRLRTMLIGVAVLAVPMAWVGYQLNWIRQRQAMLESGRVYPTGKHGMASEVPAPGWLGLFGETGWRFLSSVEATPEEFAEATRLFPESEVVTLESWWPPMRQSTNPAKQP